MTFCSNAFGRMTCATLVAIGLLGVSISATAQSVVDEITVTARKKEENLKDVPLAITAFNSDLIEAAGITNLTDVAEMTPGLSFFNAFGENLPVPIIRGVAQTNIFGETNAGIFVDGVFISGREGLNFSQLDVERIEVVKGPQSALYGRTAFSGAINYVTKRPSDEFEAKTEFEGGNRSKLKGTALVSGPIFSERLRGRIAMLFDDWDGSYDNSDHPENDIGGHTFRSYQGSLVWEPTDNLEFYASGYVSNDKIDDASLIGIEANCENRLDEDLADVRLNNFCGELPDLEDAPRPAPGLIDQNSIPKVARALGEDRDLIRAQLNITWDLSFGTFEARTAFTRTEQKSLSDFGHLGDHIPFLFCSGATVDAPGAPNSCLANPANERFLTGVLDEEFGGETEEISQEIRFTSPEDRAFRFSVGGYFFDEGSESFDGGTIATGPLPAGGVGIGLPPFDSAAPNFAIGTAIFHCTFTNDGCLDPLNRPRSDNGTRSWSVFGSADYDLNDRLTLGAELRLKNTVDELNSLVYAECEDNDPGCIDDFYDLRIVAPLPPDPVNPGNGSRSGSERFSSITGRVGLDYKLDDVWLLYASVATGDKPGGLQFANLQVVPVGGGALVREFFTQSFDTEDITAYELGLKGYTPGGRVGLDVSFFFLDWTEIVLRQIVENSPLSGRPLEQPTAFNFNAGDAEVWGWEMSADVGFTENLTGRFTVNWQDAELTDARQDTFETFPTFAPDGIVTGNKLLRQPEWMGSASLSYTRSLGGDWEWFARADATYQDRIFVGNDNQSWLPSHTYVNLRLGLTSGRYSVDLWARNLFNNDNAVAAFRDIYWSNAGGAITPPFADLGPRPSFDKFVPLRYTVSYPRLRTFGITAKIRFGAAAQ